MISTTEAELLKTKRILFAHMSVGENIIEGLEHFNSQKKLWEDFRILSLQMRRDDVEPALYHIKLGSNGDPELKCMKFFNILENQYAEYNFDMVLFKFCYVDIGRKTDVEAIFKVYQNMVEQIRRQFSNLVYIHITCPLTTHHVKIKETIKEFIFGDIGNVKRNLFNQWVVETYKDQDPIFDLAGIEATISDSEKASFTYKNKRYFYLAKPNTYDGRHLNDKGRKLAAGELLDILASAASN